MSDHEAAPDPMDKAYLAAEAALTDDAARAARRARVLAAVAAEPASPAAVTTPVAKGASWGRGGWLAAAVVAGLGVILATQIYRPAPPRPKAPPAALAAANPSDQAVAVPLLKPPPAFAPPAAPPVVEAHETPPSPAAALPPPAPPLPPPPPPAIAARVPLPADSPGSESVVVTGAKQADRASGYQAQPPAGGEERALVGGLPSGDDQASSPAFAAPPSAQRFRRPLTPVGSPADQAASLRAAAFAGRIAEVEALLTQGAPVDGVDAEGDTALIKSIRADHPAVAALLRRHGASLDRRNRAGQSARDVAKAVGDAVLNQAIGVGR